MEEHEFYNHANATESTSMTNTVANAQLKSKSELSDKDKPKSELSETDKPKSQSPEKQKLPAPEKSRYQMYEKVKSAEKSKRAGWEG